MIKAKKIFVLVAIAALVFSYSSFFININPAAAAAEEPNTFSFSPGITYNLHWYPNSFIVNKTTLESTYFFDVENIEVIETEANQTGKFLDTATVEITLCRNNFTDLLLNLQFSKIINNYRINGSSLNWSNLSFSDILDWKDKIKGFVDSIKNISFNPVRGKIKNGVYKSLDLYNKNCVTFTTSVDLEKQSNGFSLFQGKLGSNSVYWSVSSITDWDNIEASSSNTTTADGSLEVSDNVYDQVEERGDGVANEARMFGGDNNANNKIHSEFGFKPNKDMTVDKIRVNSYGIFTGDHYNTQMQIYLDTGTIDETIDGSLIYDGWNIPENSGVYEIDVNDFTVTSGQEYEFNFKTTNTNNDGGYDYYRIWTDDSVSGLNYASYYDDPSTGWVDGYSVLADIVLVDVNPYDEGSFTSTWHDYGDTIHFENLELDIGAVGNGLNVTVETSSDGATVRDTTSYSITSTGDITKQLSSLSGQYARVTFDLDSGASVNSFNLTGLTNTLPSFSNEAPTNNATISDFNPELSIDLNDQDADSLNLTIKTNASGSWEILTSYNTVNNGTYTATTTNMIAPDTTYYWSVNATDGYQWTNTSYSFTTKKAYLNVSVLNYNDLKTDSYSLVENNKSYDLIVNTTNTKLQLQTDTNYTKNITIYKENTIIKEYTDIIGLDTSEVFEFLEKNTTLKIVYDHDFFSFNITLNISIDPLNISNVSFSGYNNFNNKNYSKEITVNFTVFHGVIDQNLNYSIASQDGYYTNKTLIFSDTRRDISDSFSVDYSGLVKMKNITMSSSVFNYTKNIDFNYTSDLQNPYNLSFNFSVNSSKLAGNMSLQCYDIHSKNLTYNVSIADTYFYETSQQANTSFNLSVDYINGNNFIEIEVSDLTNNSIYKDTSYQVYKRLLFLVNEETGNTFNLSKVKGLNVTIPAKQYKLDLKAEDKTNFTYVVGETADTLRFEITYENTTDIVTRYLNIALVENSSRVAIPEKQQIHEQLIYSSLKKPIAVKALYADAYVLADYTRLAFGDALASYAYTIDTLYYLYTYTDGKKVVLCTLDGGKSSQINLDMLSYSNDTYGFNILSEEISYKKIANQTLKFYYYNVENNSIKTTFSIIDNGTKIFDYIEEDTPNELTFIFDYSTLNLDKNILTLKITKMFEDGTTETTEQTINTETVEVSGEPLIGAQIVLIVGVILLIVGLTLVATPWVFSVFGPLTCGITIALTTMTSQIWYITLLQVITLIMLVFQFLVFKEEYAGAGIR